MGRIVLACALAGAFSLCLGASAEAAVCASTFGAGSSFGGGVYAAQGSATGSRIEWAFPFIPSVNCLLGTGEVAVHLSSGSNAIRISVVADASGLPAASAIESTAVLGQMTTSTSGSIVTGLFSGTNLLAGGSTYWIVVAAEPVTGGTSAVWHVSPSVTGARAVQFTTGGWLTQPGGIHGAFRISEPVLVPTLSFWGLGILGAAVLALSACLLIRSPPPTPPA